MNDEKPLLHLDLFSGIGGFALAADKVWPGIRHTFCDNEPFSQEILRKHWPNSVIIGDIKELTRERICNENALLAERLRTSVLTTSPEENGKEGIAGLVSISGTRSGASKIGSVITSKSKIGCVNGEEKSSSTMEGNVSVVEKQNRNSLRLTTSIMMAPKIEEGTGRSHGISPLNEATQLLTNSSAITAITPRESTEYAHTKKDKKHWPDSPIFGDIRQLTTDSYRDRCTGGNQEEHATEPDQQAQRSSTRRAPSPFILTGGFPCQPFSQAGRRKGEEDDRFLWPEMCRVIGEFRPTWVIAENVRGLLTQGGGVVFERVCTDLESLGYEVQPIIIPAVAVGAPHRRDRVWFIAHATSERGGGESGEIRGEERRQDDESVPEREHADSNGSTGEPHIATNTEREGHEGDEYQEGPSSRHRGRTQQSRWDENWLEVATRLCRVDDGVRNWVDGRGKVMNSRNPRLKALGNAIVPPVAEEIMRAIQNSL